MSARQEVDPTALRRPGGKGLSSMAWTTLCSLVVGGLLLAVALRIAAGSRDRSRRAAQGHPSWSDSVGDLTPFICHRCGALNLISGEGVGPEGITVRCTQCEQRGRVPPVAPSRPAPAQGGGLRKAAPTR
jgi:predicted Zn finger-like uncharacterized protein